MKLLPSFGILALVAGSTLASDEAPVHSCPAQRWGPSCNAVCGNCAAQAVCNSLTGACPFGCSEGWSGPNCDQAECEAATCEEVGGKCIAPNVCACPASEINTVAQYSYDKDGQQTVWCDNLKKSGVKGAVVGFAVLTVSIAACGLTERQLNKGKVIGNARFHQDD